MSETYFFYQLCTNTSYIKLLSCRLHTNCVPKYENTHHDNRVASWLIIN